MLLLQIENFLLQSGMSWTRFGRIVAHDPRLVGDMRNGRQPRPALTRRIIAFITTHHQNTATTETTHAL
ncbi:hypothetical protein GTZ99_04120 [Novosphingobium sp. FSY-8]|uniref:Uncharacterized protein n=1 Tax=Novosphingobium ovatum TaxID=1908523 RepID=A0ABW9XB30_9SPHN|nr:hypothetical protein [Novosphingobium ovatum]NBC35740.1 hypothetical protein [Novosphingobium ovatum]